MLTLDAGGRKVSEVVLVCSLGVLLSNAVHNWGNSPRVDDSP